MEQNVFTQWENSFDKGKSLLIIIHFQIVYILKAWYYMII